MPSSDLCRCCRRPMAAATPRLAASASRWPRRTARRASSQLLLERRVELAVASPAVTATVLWDVCADAEMHARRVELASSNGIRFERHWYHPFASDGRGIGHFACSPPHALSLPPIGVTCRSSRLCRRPSTCTRRQSSGTSSRRVRCSIITTQNDVESCFGISSKGSASKPTPLQLGPRLDELDVMDDVRHDTERATDVSGVVS